MEMEVGKRKEVDEGRKGDRRTEVEEGMGGK
jgi:hypothetical protein